MLEEFGLETEKVRCVMCKRWILKTNSEPISIQDENLSHLIGLWATIGYRCANWKECNQYHHKWDDILC